MRRKGPQIDPGFLSLVDSCNMNWPQTGGRENDHLCTYSHYLYVYICTYIYIYPYIHTY